VQEVKSALTERERYAMRVRIHYLSQLDKLIRAAKDEGVDLGMRPVYGISPAMGNVTWVATAHMDRSFYQHTVALENELKELLNEQPNP
jgi:hypothetical protein